MNEKKKPILGQEAVTDARTLGTPRMLILGLQHLFAMFGATVLVPILVQGYGLPLSIQTTLLMAGLGTLLFHVCTKFKVPAFLGSSFAYLGGFSTVASMPAYDGLSPELKLAYAQGPGGQDGHALLPPHRHRPHDHHDRPEPLRLRHYQCFLLLVAGSGFHGYHRSGKHLG